MAKKKDEVVKEKEVKVKKPRVQKNFESTKDEAVALVERVSKLKKSERNEIVAGISRKQAKYLVMQYYQFQHYRIASEAQLRELNKGCKIDIKSIPKDIEEGDWEGEISNDDIDINEITSKEEALLKELENVIDNSRYNERPTSQLWML